MQHFVALFPLVLVRYVIDEFSSSPALAVSKANDTLVLEWWMFIHGTDLLLRERAILAMCECRNMRRRVSRLLRWPHIDVHWRRLRLRLFWRLW